MAASTAVTPASRAPSSPPSTARGSRCWPPAAPTCWPETLPGLDEALAIASLLPALALPAWISFSCRDGEHVSQGERFADCVAALDGLPGVAAVGLNCSAPQHVPALVAAAQAQTRLPIVVYPNSGEQWDGVAKCWHGVRDAEDFAAQALRWQRGGARLIGGCCRTGPAEIHALRAAVLAAGRA